MKDCFGKDLSLGDTVAFTQPGYTYELKVGVVARFTNKKVVVLWKDHRKTSTPDTYTQKFPKQLAKRGP